MFEKLDIFLDNRENKLAVQIENDILKHLKVNLRNIFQKLQMINLTLLEILLHFLFKSFQMNAKTNFWSWLMFL